MLDRYIDIIIVDRKIKFYQEDDVVFSRRQQSTSYVPDYYTYGNGNNYNTERWSQMSEGETHEYSDTDKIGKWHQIRNSIDRQLPSISGIATVISTSFVSIPNQ